MVKKLIQKILESDQWIARLQNDDPHRVKLDDINLIANKINDFTYEKCKRIYQFYQTTNHGRIATELYLNQFTLDELFSVIKMNGLYASPYDDSNKGKIKKELIQSDRAANDRRRFKIMHYSYNGQDNYSEEEEKETFIDWIVTCLEKGI